MQPQLGEILSEYLGGPNAPPGPLLFSEPGTGGRRSVHDWRKSLDEVARGAEFAPGGGRTRRFRVAYASHRLSTLDEHGLPISAWKLRGEMGHSTEQMKSGERRQEPFCAVRQSGRQGPDQQHLQPSLPPGQQLARPWTRQPMKRSVCQGSRALRDHCNAHGYTDTQLLALQRDSTQFKALASGRGEAYTPLRPIILPCFVRLRFPPDGDPLRIATEKASMKVLGWKAALVLVLSMLVWWAFYAAFPSAPPDAADTTVIVGVVLVVVLGTASLLARIRKRPGGLPPAGAESGDPPA
jgi:hypothetical protein